MHLLLYDPTQPVYDPKYLISIVIINNMEKENRNYSFAKNVLLNQQLDK
jgi:hypothetical protein